MVTVYVLVLLGCFETTEIKKQSYLIFSTCTYWDICHHMLALELELCPPCVNILELLRQRKVVIIQPSYSTPDTIFTCQNFLVSLLVFQ